MTVNETTVKAMTEAEIEHGPNLGCPFCDKLRRDIREAAARGKYLFPMGEVLEAMKP